MTTSEQIHPAMDDHALAAAIAARTSAALLHLQRERGVTPDDPDGVRDLKDAGDDLAHRLITSALAQARPGDAVMSEEGDWADPARLGARRLWIVDPLDATKEYGIGVADWAVQIALLEDDRLVAAAMDLGARGVRWSTTDAPLPPPAVHEDGTMVVVVSRSRAPEGLDALLSRTVALLADEGVERYALRRVGGVGGKVDELLQGRAHLYVGPTWCHEWDAAAPVAIAERHGHRACGPGGTPLRFNTPRALVEGLLVGPATAVEAVIAASSSV